MHALVVDAHHPNSVAGIRGLGRAGVRAVALGPRRSAAGRWSRFAAARELGPIAEVAARRGPIVAYPGEEATIDALLDLAPSDRLVLPWDAAPLAALREKGALGALAEPYGLAVPATLFDGRAGELARAGVPLPAVVKPALAVGALRTAHVVRSHEELEQLAAGLPAGEPVLAQELAEGRLRSLALVLDRDGALAARFEERVTRTWPREAGTFAATVSVDPDERLVEAARSMLADAGYWGLAQLDLIETGRGTLLLDVNPRFYFCMPLALRCGINLPAAWHAVVEGGSADGPRPYPAGRTYRWLEGDLYAARHGHLGRLRPGRPAHAHTMWAADDPLPSALLALDAVSRPVRRRRAERRAGA
jgi:hypothetical protein